MDKKTWMEKLVKEMGERFGGDYHLTLERRKQGPVIKIQKEGEEIGIEMDLSVDAPGRLYQEDKLKEAAHALHGEYTNNRQCLMGAPLLNSTFEGIKHMVVYVLEKRAGNEEALSHIPYKAFLDRVLVFELHLYTGSNRFRRVITNEDMQQWGISLQELLTAARKNTPALYPPVAGLAEKTSLFVLTSESEQYGAVSILYDGVLEEIAGAFQDHIVIFPTSPHEVLLFPYQEDGWPLEQWLETVSEMEQMKELGDWSFQDGVYLYDRENKTIRQIQKGMNQVNGLTS